MHLLVRTLILFSLNLYLIGGNGQMNSSAKGYVCDRLELRESIGFYEWCYKNKWSPLPYPNTGLDGRLCCFLKDQECRFEEFITNDTFLTVDGEVKPFCEIREKNDFEEFMKKRFEDLINDCSKAGIHLNPEFCNNLGPRDITEKTQKCKDVYHCSTDRLKDPKIPTDEETQRQGYLCKDRATMVQFYYKNTDLQKCFQHKWGLSKTNLDPNTQKTCCLHNDVICLHNQLTREWCDVNETIFDVEIAANYRQLSNDCVKYNLNTSDAYCNSLPNNPLTPELHQKCDMYMNCHKPVMGHICEDLSVYENNEFLIRKCLDDKWSLGVENGNPNRGKECCFQYETIVSLANMVKDLCKIREPTFSNSNAKQLSDLEKNCTEFGSDLSETYCQKFSVEPITNAICLKYITKRKMSTTLEFPQITPSNQNESTPEEPLETDTEDPELAKKDDNNSSTILCPISQQFLSLILSLLLIFI